MDANGLSFWLLGDAADWRAREHVCWDADCGALALASERRIATPLDAAAFGIAQGALEAVPRCADRFGGVARWDAAASAVVVHSHLPGDVVRMPLAEAPSDLCAGDDDILYLVFADRVLMHDLRGRFDDEPVPTGGFAPWRVAAAAGGGLWMLERGSGRIARLSGRPMPLTTPARGFYAPGVFRPDPENCHPPRLDLLPSPAYGSGETALAIAACADAVLGVLAWGVDGEARVHALRRNVWAAPRVLADARYAYALAWFDDGSRIALRLPGRGEAPSFELAAPDGGAGDDGAAPLLPLGEIHPLPAGSAEAPFVHRLDGPPRVPLADGSAEPLLPLSRRFLAPRGRARHWRYAGSGETAVLDARLLDSGRPATVWHRLYAEASIPPGCGFVVWLAASAGAAPPEEDSGQWQPHAFGADIAALAADSLTRQTPRAAWSRAASELPGHPGLGRWGRERDRRGLFEVLIQHGDQRVRRLTGRYLWARVELYGNVQAGPEIVALRAYAGRFDYVDHYLPRLYRESLHGEPAQEPGEVLARFSVTLAGELDAAVLPAGLQAALAADAALPPPTVQVRVEQAGRRWRLVEAPGGAGWPLLRRTTLVAGTPVAELALYRPLASPSDFLSRQLANVEGVLTTLEDRVAAAHLLSDPSVVADASLDWLGSWIGIAFDPALPAARRRAWLKAAPLLARWHGTRRGLAMALDVATGASVEVDAAGTITIGASTPGGVSGGEIVVIEDFRLRRLVATLLGVDLADEEDPLLGGLVRSGNSIVGDTLALGDHAMTELLALFREEVASAAEDAAVRRFYDRLAHRVTVLVHREVEPQDFALIRRIGELEAPAHVLLRVVGATWPLLVGVASLVGVDTYLGPPRPRRTARVQVSSLGLGDIVVAPAVLDPRMAGSAAPLAAALPPVADAGADRTVPYATSFTLDGSGSHAGSAARHVETWIWRLLPPDDG